ncbi:MAG: nucleotidyltransferase domain-containing protein [Chloroflexota bacterium]
MKARISTLLSRRELESYRKALTERRQKEMALIESRFQIAWEIAHRAAEILKSEFGARKVAAFGSLLHASLFHTHSDVDLAVWGLTGREYFRAVGVLQSIYPTIEVDVIAFEETSPSMQELIRKEGINL